MSSVSESGCSNNRNQGRPGWSYLLLACLIFLGAGAIYGGVSFILDPTGGMLGIPLEWLQGSPFVTYLVPGIFLLVVLGFGSFIAAYGFARRGVWAWPAGIALGIVTVLWIIIQYGVIQHYYILQPIIAGVGAAIIVLLLVPSMRQYYRATATLAWLREIRRR